MKESMKKARKRGNIEVLEQFQYKRWKISIVISIKGRRPKYFDSKTKRYQHSSLKFRYIARQMNSHFYLFLKLVWHKHNMELKSENVKS